MSGVPWAAVLRCPCFTDRRRARAGEYASLWHLDDEPARTSAARDAVAHAQRFKVPASEGRVVLRLKPNPLRAAPLRTRGSGRASRGGRSHNGDIVPPAVALGPDAGRTTGTRAK